MAKIIKMKSKNESILQFLEECKEEVIKNNIDNIMVAMKLKQEDAYVMTGYANLNMAEKQELLGHIQVDIVKDMIQENYITPEE